MERVIPMSDADSAGACGPKTIAISKKKPTHTQKKQQTNK
jgi:hypothetical protein